MFARSDFKKDPIVLFTEELLNGFNDYINNNKKKYRSMEHTMKMLLLNNGCMVSKEKDPKYYTERIHNSYHIIYVTGMMGNKNNIFYDYAEFRGCIHLFIFLDYFNKLTEYKDIDLDREYIDFETIMGNSTYFDAFRILTEVFMTSFYNPAILTNKLFNTTVIGTNYRFCPYIVAAIMINAYSVLSEEDVEGSPIGYEDIINIIDSEIPLKDVLIGIRVDDE